FQDEDGIRDRNLTGVQACALPFCTFYARGQTGQQLLLGAYKALERQIAAGNVETYTRHEMLELVVVDDRARGIVVRNMVTGEIRSEERRVGREGRERGGARGWKSR